MENLNGVIWNDEDNAAEPYIFGDPNIKGPHICIQIMYDSSSLVSGLFCSLGSPSQYSYDVCVGIP